MGPLRREAVADTVLVGETASLLHVPRAGRGAAAPQEDDPFSRAFETGGGGGAAAGYAIVQERVRDGPEGPMELPAFGVHAYQAQPSPMSNASPSSSSSSAAKRHRNTTTKTRFPSLTPAPGSFRASGDTRAAEAVAHARKTWAPPALRTQAVASYGAVPDLEVIPEDTEVNRFQIPHRVRRYADLGCPSCTIS